MKLADFASYFRNEAVEADSATYATATSVLDWMRQDYHAEFEAWLNAEASKPFDIGPKLVESAMRVNAFREILRHLAKLRAEAIAARARIQEGD